MKNYLSKIFAVLIVIATVNSCTTRDNVIDDVLDGVANGAVLRTVSIIDTEYAIGSADPNWSVLIEEQDVQDGALLDNVQVFVSYRDTSEGTTTSETLYQTISASEFDYDTPHGLPRTMISISLADALAATGTDEADIFGGDFFPVRLLLTLTNGETYTNTDAAGIITGGFFASPYLYNVPVVCSIPDDYFKGAYTVERTSTDLNPFFGCCDVAWDPNPQAITIGGSGAQRTFTYPYFPNFFAFPQAITMDLSCGDIIFTGTAVSGSLGCGGGLTIQQGPAPGALPTYSLADDSSYAFDIEDFSDDGGCGTGSYIVSLLFTKQ
ncbi:MAG: hypothetical protein KJO77_07675 [Bacteroidia bacterium]|nr:hypothetical protein [Bacteroidia bacterium]NND51059.1 hypothetical protein [Flavobacteriaceae bacterium]